MRLDSHQHFWPYDPAHHVRMGDAMTLSPDERAGILGHDCARFCGIRRTRLSP